MTRYFGLTLLLVALFVPASSVLAQSSCAGLSVDLARGDTDASTNGQVSILQTFLVTNEKAKEVVVSGRYDNATKAAVEKFQKKHAISTGASGAGSVGPITRAVIKRECNNVPKQTANTLKLGKTVKSDHVSLKIPDGWKATKSVEQMIIVTKQGLDGGIILRWTKGDDTLEELVAIEIRKLRDKGATILDDDPVRVGNKPGYYIDAQRKSWITGETYRERTFIVEEGIIMYFVTFALSEKDFATYYPVVQKSIDSLVIKKPNYKKVKFIPENL